MTDLDVSCPKPFDQWLPLFADDIYTVEHDLVTYSDNITLMTGFEGPASKWREFDLSRQFTLATWCIAAKPHHPAIWHALKHVAHTVATTSAEDLRYNHPRVTLLVTGPGAWSDAFQEYLLQQHSTLLATETGPLAGADDRATLIGSMLVFPWRAFGESWDRLAMIAEHQRQVCWCECC